MTDFIVTSCSWDQLLSDFLEQFCVKRSHFVVSEGSSVLLRACVLTVAGVGWGGWERCRSGANRN